MSSITELAILPRQSAVLDEAHVGHINGALGTIQHGDIAPRIGWVAKLKTLLAILGPGLIVMVGDNDAGAFGTYTKRGRITAQPCCGPWRCWSRCSISTRRWFCGSALFPASDMPV
jgi:hypothetical protein